jgi:hypothetical protein
MLPCRTTAGGIEMFDIEVAQDVVEYAAKLATKVNFGKRGSPMGAESSRSPA